MTSPEQPGPPPLKKRRRPALACVQCRRRKIRCDQNTPCQNCVKAGISPCEIPPNHISTLRGAGTTNSSSTGNTSPQDVGGSLRQHGDYGVRREEEEEEYHQIARRDSEYHASERRGESDCRFHSLLQRQDSEQHRGGGATPRPLAAGPSGTLTPGPTPRSDSSGAASGVQVEALLSKIEGLQKTVDKLQADIRADEEERRQAATTRREASPGPRFGNQSSWINDTVLYRTVLRTLKEFVAENPDSSLALHLKTCQALLQTIEGHLTMPSFISCPLGSRMPDEPTRRTLLHHYYATYESVFRVLDVPLFEEEHYAYTQMQDPSQAREIFVLQLQMCLALGSKSLHRQREGNNTAGLGDTLSYRNVANHWLCQAQSWLATKGKKHAVTFEALQLYTLMALYEAEEQGAEKPAWILTGDLVRRAICLNLHQDPKRLGETNYRKAELHRRLWATILELNLLMSVQTGQPPGISLSDYDTEPPLDLHDLELGPTTIEPQNRDHIPDMRYPLALFSSFPLRLQIAARCNQGSPLTNQEFLSFHRDLDLAWGALEKSSRGWYSHLPRHAYNLTRNILASQILALHLPIIGRHGIDDPMHLTSRIVAKTMSLAILEQVAPSQCAQDETIRNLFTASGCLWRNIVTQAVFYLALEQCTISDEIRTHGRASITSGDVSTIDSTMVFVRDWVYDRIGMGMKDTHCICFLAAAHRMATDTTTSRQPSDVPSLLIAGAGDLAASCERKLTRLADETVRYAVREPETQEGAVAHEMAITGVMNPVVDMNWITQPCMAPYDEMLFGWTFDASMGGMVM